MAATTKVEIVTPGIQGPKGDPGESAGGQGTAPLFVQPTDPGMIEPGLWIQTGMGSGDDFTFWIEDGA